MKNFTRTPPGQRDRQVTFSHARRAGQDQRAADLCVVRERQLLAANSPPQRPCELAADRFEVPHPVTDQTRPIDLNVTPRLPKRILQPGAQHGKGRRVRYRRDVSKADVREVWRSGIIHRGLKQMWGFQGVVTSDWGATHETLGTMQGGLDTEMPSGASLNEARISPLLRAGTVTQAMIDGKIRRLLRVILAMGFDARQQKADGPRNSPDGEAATLDIAREGIVMLKSEKNLLPLDGKTLGRVVVLAGCAGLR